VDRRTFIARTGTVGAAAAAATAFGSSGPWAAVARARAEAIARTAGSAVAPQGTTLERTLVHPDRDGGFLRFSEGPGEPINVRAELAEPQPGREDRRVALSTIVHLTDIHVIDTQSPLRVEFLDRYEDPATANPGFASSAWRPQETLVGHVGDAMVRQLRAIGRGPVTGRAFDAAVSTGDATDNQQLNELEWLLDLLDGGRPVAFNSGDPDRYEGVQDGDELSYDPAYWHPTTDRGDAYKDGLGYPVRPEMLDLAVAPFTPVGLPCPWYSVYGNHDGIVQGNLFGQPGFDAIATSELKVVGLPPGLSQAQIEAILTDAEDGDVAELFTAPGAPVRTVTADADRRTITAFEWAEMHLRSRGGPGPVGHGMGPESVETGELHYTFDLGEHVLGIGLDTVNRTGFAQGSIDRPQFAWLEEQLIAHSSRYYDGDGQERTTDNEDRYIVLFAHHGTDSLNNPFPDVVHPSPGERVLADELIALLDRFPNVVAFVVGHTHRNAVTPHPPTLPDTGGWWELTTAAHVDHPQQARLIEVVDNEDGTLSIFGTIIDHAGPVRAPDVATDVLGAAALARELGLNDAQANLAARAGDVEDRNVELLLDAPFARTAAQPPAEEPTTDDGGDDDRRGHGPPPGTPSPAAGAPADRPLPVTGGSGAAVGAAMVAGAAVAGSALVRDRDGLTPLEADHVGS
jgi:metallophosphoesterase (TIGR03767 family)